MSKDITNNFSVLNADLPESVDNALKILQICLPKMSVKHYLIVGF